MTLHRPPRALSENGFGDFMRINEKGERIIDDGMIRIDISELNRPPKSKEELIKSIQSFCGVKEDQDTQLTLF